MVKASELRIGNIYNRKHGKGWTETVMDERIINLIFSNDSEYALNDFEPIELTEELMIKLGFEYLSEPVPDAENPFKQNFGHDFYKNGKIKLQSHYRSFTEKTLSIRASEEHQIYYLHQLQNLFFSLTGRELELTK